MPDHNLATKQAPTGKKQKVRLFTPALSLGDERKVHNQLIAALEAVDAFNGVWMYPSEGSLTDREGGVKAEPGIVIEIFVASSDSGT